MLIMVAGPYSAPDAAGRAANLARINAAAVAVAKAGHIPLVGVNAALPVLDAAGLPPGHPWMMGISLALAARCDGCLLIAPSPGAEREAAVLAGLGRPVWRRIEDLPPA